MVRWRWAHWNLFLLAKVQWFSLQILSAGAINRKLNHTGEKNYKDEMADRVIHALDLQLGEEEVDGIDVTTLFKI